MRIERRKRDGRELDALRDELAAVLDDARPTGRVCGAGCNAPCPSCGLVTCRCKCSRTCPDLPRALSCDPKNFPVESCIAPLVYVLKNLGFFDPCWSCQGHNDNAGKLWKIPRVWFYCRSVVYLRLLADAVAEMKHQGHLNVRWRVGVTLIDDDNPDTTFSLEPMVTAGDGIDLKKLQDDTAAIAERLGAVIVDRARALLETTQPVV